jgi:YVTN family beta-propeller protein
VIDGAADTFVAIIWVAGTPSALCYDSLDNKLYCINGAQIDVIDGATNYILNTLFIDPAPSGFCYGAQFNRIYCVSESGRVTVIDCGSDSILAVVNVGYLPAAPTYNAGSDRVYCIHPGSNSVSVLDAVTNRVLQTVEVDQAPLDICLNQSGSRAYVANSVSSSISVIRDSLIGIVERPEPDVRRPWAGATIIRRVLFLPEAASPKPQASSWLLDITGRKVLELRPGANDVRALAPGVYFVRLDHGVSRISRKVVLTE